MQNTTENNVVTRLKHFIEFCGLSNSQFADKTGIPRPTLSQLVNGRNKSVNDLLLRKLHDTFPNLNVSWLLFGVGNMLSNSNIQFSEAQNSTISGRDDLQYPDSKPFSTLFEEAPATSNYSQTVISPDNDEDFAAFSAISTNNEPQVDEETSSSDSSVANNTKKIKSIIVFYTDSRSMRFLAVSSSSTCSETNQSSLPRVA